MKARTPRRFTTCLLALASLGTDSAPIPAEPIKLEGPVEWPARGESRLSKGDPSTFLLSLEGMVSQAFIGPATVLDAFQVVHVSSSATVGRLEVRGLNATVTNSCVRGHAGVVVVTNTHCTMTGPPQVGRVNMPFGLQVTGAQSVSVSHSSFEGFEWRGPPDRYWIGEGVTIERGVRGVQFDDVSSNGNTDAGFDIKPYVIMTNVSASANCRNFRFWSGADVGTLTTGDTIRRGGTTSCSGIWLSGSKTGPRPTLHIRKLVVRMNRPGPIIQIENGPADIQLDACDIQAPPGTAIVRFEKGVGKLVLGHGCKLPLPAS
jgi:hypothetical protein